TVDVVPMVGPEAGTGLVHAVLVQRVQLLVVITERRVGDLDPGSGFGGHVVSRLPATALHVAWGGGLPPARVDRAASLPGPITRAGRREGPRACPRAVPRRSRPGTPRPRPRGGGWPSPPPGWSCRSGSGCRAGRPASRPRRRRSGRRPPSPPRRCGGDARRRHWIDTRAPLEARP